MRKFPPATRASVICVNARQTQDKIAAQTETETEKDNRFVEGADAHSQG